jgi:hypothetical protein
LKKPPKDLLTVQLYFFTNNPFHAKSARSSSWEESSVLT